MAIVATRWTAAEAKLKQHLSSTVSTSATAVSVGGLVGPNGLDIGNSIDIGTARANSSLWVYGDAGWPTAVGMTRGTALANYGGFLHNLVGLQVGRDLSSCTYTYYNGASDTAPVEFFPPTQGQGTPAFKYPTGGVLLDDRVMVVGMHGANQVNNPLTALTPTMSGPWATILHGVATGAPNTWPQQEVTIDAHRNYFHTTNQYAFACNPLDPGDGWVYFPMFGPSTRNAWAICRADRVAAKNGDLTQLFWWDGGTRWLKDVRDARTGAMTRRRRNILGATVNGADQIGGITKRSDGNWQLTAVPTGWYGAAPTISYAVGGTSLAAQFPGWTTIINVALTDPNDFVYGAYSFPEQTWTGKAASDQFILYSRNRNATNVLTDSTSYWPEIYQVTGL